MRYPPWTEQEDDALREWAGTMSAEQIGAILGRPKNGVHSRVEKLGLDGRLWGENHWRAKLPNLQAAAVGILYDGGLTTNEIHRLLTEPVEISRAQVMAIARGDNRR